MKYKYKKTVITACQECPSFMYNSMYGGFVCLLLEQVIEDSTKIMENCPLQDDKKGE